MNVRSKRERRRRLTRPAEPGPWHRNTRSVARRVPGPYPLAIHQALNGPDAPLTKRDLLFLVAYLLEVFALIPALVVTGI